METKFRDRNAHRCDRFMKKDETTYEQMCAKIRPAVKGKQVLELAAGTGLISRHIADSASFIEVTDALPEMITKAEKGVPPKTFLFPCRTFFLPYEAGSFDIIILVNALHILSTPEKALAEIRRVLKDDGVFIAPHLHPWGKYASRKAPGVFHGSCRLSPSQPLVQQRVSLLPRRKRLERGKKRRFKSVLLPDL